MPSRARVPILGIQVVIFFPFLCRNQQKALTIFILLFMREGRCWVEQKWNHMRNTYLDHTKQDITLFHRSQSVDVRPQVATKVFYYLRRK